jgi:predicted O-methyltransferase YrrM
MYWTKAIPSGELTLEQIKRSFGAIEAPDHVIFLASALNILSSGLGFKASAEHNTPVLGDGRPIPMMSYGLIEYLLGLDLTSFEVLELGGGGSTVFWAAIARSVLTLETSAEWVAALNARHLSNVEARCCEGAKLPEAVAALERRFDAIVIDCAANRLGLTQCAVARLSPGGFVLLDNSDWYPNAARALRDADLIQVDFHDFRPLHSYRCTTSLFLHREFRAKPRGARLPLPPIGGKDVAETNSWDRPAESGAASAARGA